MERTKVNTCLGCDKVIPLDKVWCNECECDADAPDDTTWAYDCYEVFDTDDFDS